MRGTAILNSGLTKEEALVGQVERLGNFNENENIILGLGKVERHEQICFLGLKKAHVLN